MSPKSVVLYTRAGCHLCDDAEALLRRHRLHPILVDIDTDPQLVERYGDCVPVVEIDGVLRFRGRVDEVLLRRLLVSTAAVVTNLPTYPTKSQQHRTRERNGTEPGDR